MSRFAWLTIAIALFLAAWPVPAAAVGMPDGTLVRVRLLNVITSETSTVGEPLAFVVAADVVVAGEVVIPKGTHVAGRVVKARRLGFGFPPHGPRLAFTFTQTTGRNGQAILLRASRIPQKQEHDLVVLNSGGLEHGLLWADGADMFDAYVAGNYQF